jgi:hypothetical protein
MSSRYAYMIAAVAAISGLLFAASAVGAAVPRHLDEFVARLGPGVWVVPSGSTRG